MLPFRTRWRPHGKVLIIPILCMCFILVSFLNLLLHAWEKRHVDIDQKFDYDSNLNYENLTSSQFTMFKMIEAKATEILIENRSLVLDIWMNSGKLNYEDAMLVEYVRQTYLIPPDKSMPYNLSSNVTNPSEGQVQSVWPFLENITDGFFVDCGSNDGEFISNTLWLEKEKGWNGLLIEADPETFSNLQLRHRKAWHANLCLSTDRNPKTTSFFRNPKNDGLSGLNKRPDFGATVEIKVQCIPLYTILLALERTVIDFFSLDIEGLELEVLKTIPFDKILIKTFAIAYKHIPGGAPILESFMKEKSYYFFKTITTPHYSMNSIFIHNSLPPTAAG